MMTMRRRRWGRRRHKLEIDIRRLRISRQRIYCWRREEGGGEGPLRSFLLSSAGGLHAAYRRRTEGGRSDVCMRHTVQ